MTPKAPNPRLVRSGWVALATALALAPTGRAAGPWITLADPDNALSLRVLRDGQPVFRVGPAGWGPKWAWVGLQARPNADGDRLSVRVPFVVNKGAGEVIDVRFEAWSPAARQIALRYDLEADKDVPLTLLVAAADFDAEAGKGTLTLTDRGGKRTKVPLPVRGVRPGPVAATAELAFDHGGTVGVTFDPPCPVAFDNALRVALAADRFPKGRHSVTLTLTFPEDVDLLVRPADLEKFARSPAGADWFPFRPSKAVTPGVIDLTDWLDRPAGKHGGVRVVKDRFAFADGTPVKFWGTNLSYTASAPDRETADFTAARFAKYGVNAVRMHKFSYPTGQMGIGDPNDSTRMDPQGLDRLDYFAAKLKEHGVYFGWSHTFGFKVVPGDRKRLLAYDEIEKNLKGNTYAFVHFAEDVQDLMIGMVVNLLRHKNPYTGLTYAEEPALCFVELQNEDDIFFYTSPNALDACPTYKKAFLARFAAWLKGRYGSQDKLKAAWGDALKAGETLDAAGIVPQVNPWFFGSDNLPKQSGGARRRLLDTAAFLHDVQNRFYTRFVTAIREAGYQGPLCGSPWQAPSMLPHYYNLRSDHAVGFIDRHNYFDGAGKAMFASMLTKPGSGYLGSGLEQAADRPFALSEWIHVYPNAHAAEGPAVVAAYGMGLQGWDASYEFQSQAHRQVFSDIGGSFPWGVWEADVPSSLGQYPTLARMVLRGDVKEGEVIAARRVSPEDLSGGTFPFEDKVEQAGDVKTFTGTVPGEALAAGRVVVEFADRRRPPLVPDLKRYRDGSAIRSTTGQLAWDTAGRGFFTADTPGTKAVVGFAQGKEQKLGGVTVRLDTPFAVFVLTAAGRDEDLATGKRALISVLARQSNTGFRYFAPDGRVLNNGGPPLLLEPVKATVGIAGRPVEAVHVLDHDGRRTGRTLPAADGRFTLDGARDKAIYYEVVFR
jgi:hypothetical protein